MIKTFSPQTCAFDCEWVPCPDTARRLLHLSPAVPDRVVFQEIWAHYAKEGEDRPFLKLAISRVVSIAAVTRRVSKQGEIDLKLVSRGVDTRPEADLIRNFLETVAEHKYQLWGFNSAGSDLPILKQRALVLDVPCPAFNKRPDKPWEGYDYHDSRNSEAHMDIMQLVSGFNRGTATPTLHELAVASGIPGKLDTAGSDVADLYLARRISDIVAYNETDALTTHLLMLRLAHHTGRLDTDRYQAELTAVDQLLDEHIAHGRTHLARFRTVWHAYRSGQLPPGPSADHPHAHKLNRDWEDFLQRVHEQLGIKTMASLRAVRHLAATDTEIHFAMGTNQFSRDMLMNQRPQLESHLAAYLGVDTLTLICALGDGVELP